MFKRLDFVLVNRSFWPHNQVIGEALLQVAEKASKNCSVGVVTQFNGNLKEVASLNHRGVNVNFWCCRNLASSSSGILMRGLESIFFMFWVALTLLCTRPRKVYVATDPPIAVPFIVFLYCKVSKAKFYYHLQDIHPEAANAVLPLNSTLFGFLKFIDNISIKGADKIITLTESMKSYTVSRAKISSSKIVILDNPSFEVASSNSSLPRTGVVFCGNAGRLQYIPLIVSSIEQYIKSGGLLKFTFIGGGIYSESLEELASTCKQVAYLGFLPAEQANELVAQCKWALLPIDNKVMDYAFPSKSSSYVLSGCAILSVCDATSCVAKWVVDNNLGVNSAPKVEALVDALFHIERTEYTSKASPELLYRLKLPSFVASLLKIIF